MIANSTTLRFNFLPSQWWYSDMLSNSYIKVSYAFTIIGFIAESTLKFINDTRCKFLGNIMSILCQLINLRLSTFSSLLIRLVTLASRKSSLDQPEIRNTSISPRFNYIVVLLSHLEMLSSFKFKLPTAALV